MTVRKTMEKLRIGIVGIGNRATFARLIHRPDAGVVVTAMADRDPTRFAQAAEWFGPDVVAVTDHRRLAELDIDAVMVMTPDDTHESITVDLLSAGLAVYAEKSLATTIDGCDRILAAARDHGAKLYVGHNMRHMGFVQRMRALIADGAIGEVKTVWCRHFVGNGGDYYFKDWHAERSRTTSLLLQKGAHDIDVIHWLADGYTSRVTAMGGLTLYGEITSRGGTPRPPGGKVNFDHWPPLSQRGLNDVVDVEDLEMVTMELDNGVFATYQQCQ